MSDQVDNWHKLARFDTNMQGELHANLLHNNGISVSLQALSAMPGMNSGIVMWVQDTDLVHAKDILGSIDTGGETPYEMFDESSEETDSNTASHFAKADNNADNNGGNL